MLMSEKNIDSKMKDRGFELFLLGGDHTYFEYLNTKQVTIACCINLINQTFQLKHRTLKCLTVQTGECGSFFDDTHFNRIYTNILDFIVKGD